MVPAVVSATRILDLLRSDDGALGISDISRTLHMSKATVYRLVHTLAMAEYIELDGERGRYRLGRKLVQLGSVAISRLDVARLAFPYLDALMRRHEEEVHLGVLVQGEVVYVSRAVSNGTPAMLPRVGLRAPVHCTSVGKALIAFQPAGVIAALTRNGLKRYTPRTVTDPKQLRRDLVEVHRHGYATSFEEFEIGLNAVGAPVRDHAGEVSAAISISGPAHRMTRVKIAQSVPDLLKAARGLSRELGHESAPLP